MKGYVQRWLDDPDGGGAFSRQARLVRQHNPDCPSLDHIWMPRRGGYSCLALEVAHAILRRNDLKDPA